MKSRNNKNKIILLFLFYIIKIINDLNFLIKKLKIISKIKSNYYILFYILLILRLIITI